MPQNERTYIAIDLKSYYASVECMERGLDPMQTNLVVADPSRTEKTICLAVSPALKAYGIRTCYYGHLHGNAIRYAVQGDVDGIRYKLVSADGLKFCPYRIN